MKKYIMPSVQVVKIQTSAIMETSGVGVNSTPHNGSFGTKRGGLDLDLDDEE